MFFDDVRRTLLYFREDFGEILSENSHAEKLYAAKEGDDADQRGKTCYRVAPYESLDKEKQQKQK